MNNEHMNDWTNGWTMKDPTIELRNESICQWNNEWLNEWNETNHWWGNNEQTNKQIIKIMNCLNKWDN